MTFEFYRNQPIAARGGLNVAFRSAKGVFRGAKDDIPSQKLPDADRETQQ